MKAFADDVVSLDIKKGEKIHLFPINWTFIIYQTFYDRPFLQYYYYIKKKVQ